MKTHCGTPEFSFVLCFETGVKSDDPRFIRALESQYVKNKAVYFVTLESGAPAQSIRCTDGMQRTVGKP